MEEKMNLIQKIAKVRCDFLNKDVKKSGFNKYANFKYFELKDILPVCNELCEQYGILPVYSFGNENAELVILDTETDKTVTFKVATNIEDTNARMGQDKQSRGMQPVQRLGSVVTYCKRYLYLNFLDIVEDDSIDPLEQNQTQQKKQETNNSTSAKEEINLGIEYTKLRTKLNGLGVNYRDDKVTIEYICKTANVSTQDIELLDTNSLKRLNMVYKKVIESKEKERAK